MREKDIYLKQFIEVTSEDALKNAIKVGYGKICIKGEYANNIAGKLRTNDTGNKLSNAGLIAGLLFFTPLFLAGVVGKILTRDLSKYRITDVSDCKVTLKHKSLKD
ncbi:hypothetical protein [Clostridium transplantifaecale]|uniref:hypothetical protein n=1 Tax=Clostridium transplantifaecale TaxID=2479838 RepID=UPI000F63255F|nr:hypothetical protein [Clostridium transplantifaecale]